MKAHKVETVLSEDGALRLKDLPFRVGDVVEVIILERSPSISTEKSPRPMTKAVAGQPNCMEPPLRSGILQPAVFSSELQRTNKS